MNEIQSNADAEKAKLDAANARADAILVEYTEKLAVAK
jgi:hypothetical protein